MDIKSIANLISEDVNCNSGLVFSEDMAQKFRLIEVNSNDMNEKIFAEAVAIAFEEGRTDDAMALISEGKWLTWLKMLAAGGLMAISAGCTSPDQCSIGGSPKAETFQQDPRSSWDSSAEPGMVILNSKFTDEQRKKIDNAVIGIAAGIVTNKETLDSYQEHGFRSLVNDLAEGESTNEELDAITSTLMKALDMSIRDGASYLKNYDKEHSETEGKKANYYREMYYKMKRGEVPEKYYKDRTAEYEKERRGHDRSRYNDVRKSLRSKYIR